MKIMWIVEIQILNEDMISAGGHRNLSNCKSPPPPNKKKIQDFNTIWTHGPTCVSAAVLHQEIKK